MEIEQEREEIELRRQQEKLRLQQQKQQRGEVLHLQQQQQEQELRLKMQQQQEDELRRRQHERYLENERRKTEADEEQRRLKLELTKGSSRASGSVADEIESVGPRRNHEITAGWAESVAQQSVDGHYLQTLLSTLQKLSHRTELTNVSAPTRKLPRCSNRVKAFSQCN